MKSYYVNIYLYISIKYLIVYVLKYCIYLYFPNSLLYFENIPLDCNAF